MLETGRRLHSYTGPGSRGSGCRIAKRLAADGAKVAITYTQGADAAACVVKEIDARKKGHRHPGDAADPKPLGCSRKSVATLSVAFTFS